MFNSPNVAGSKGFTLLEILVSAALLIVVSSASFVLCASARQLAFKPTHRIQAFLFASETLETLKDYVTANPTKSVAGTPVYSLVGDFSPYALQNVPHQHVIPSTGFLSFFRTQLSGLRGYQVSDVDLDPTFDTDRDGNPANDADYKKVTVIVTWTDPR